MRIPKKYGQHTLLFLITSVSVNSYSPENISLSVEKKTNI